MKTLYIVRHGKSSWENPVEADHERILLPKGVKRTLLIASFLKEKKIKPDLIVSSSANRAYETAAIIAGHLDYPLGDIIRESSFYEAEDSTILDYLFGVENDLNSIMIVGHNPSFTYLANLFLENPMDYLPTSGLVSINFDTSKWEDILLAKRETNFVIYPKML